MMTLFKTNVEEAERKAQAISILSGWLHATAPSRMAHGVSALFGGLPAVAYAPPALGRGACAYLATANLGGDLLCSTRFVTDKIIFSPTLADIGDNPIFGAIERPVMGQELSRDADRWQIFREALLTPLAVTDNLSVRFVDQNGRWIGWCGVFNRGSGWFTESDSSRYAAILDPLRDIVYACHTLAPGSGLAHPGLQIAHAWPEPAFAVTDKGYPLFVNRRGRRELKREPEWVRGALTNASSIPAIWQSLQVCFPRGIITIFFRAHASQSRRFIDAAASAGLMLPAYLGKLLGGVLRGSTVPELAKSSGIPATTVATYIARIRERANAENRAHLTYRALEHVLGEPDLWPTVIPVRGPLERETTAPPAPSGK